MNDYELLRLATIKSNQELLLSLGLAPTPSSTPSSSSSSTSSKGKSTAKKQNPTEVLTPSRRSERARTIPSQGSSITTRTRSTQPISRFIDDSALYTPNTKTKTTGRNPPYGMPSPQRIQQSALRHRIHDPKTIGPIPGVKVGSWWEWRAGVSRDAIHAPLVAGISGTPTLGCQSICFSSSYTDNLDLGYTFTLTGCGGRALKGTAAQPKNLRTAAQSFDQGWENRCNESLRVSARTGGVVRVVRGWKTECDWAPMSGYRYDGLYTVTSAELVQSADTGFKVCKFGFKRLPGQPPIPRRSDNPGVDVHALAALEQPDDLVVQDSGIDDADEEDEEDIPLSRSIRRAAARAPSLDSVEGTPSLMGSSATPGSQTSGWDSPVPVTPARVRPTINGAGSQSNHIIDNDVDQNPIMVDLDDPVTPTSLRRSGRPSPGEKRYTRPFYKPYIEVERTPSKSTGSSGRKIATGQGKRQLVGGVEVFAPIVKMEVVEKKKTMTKVSKAQAAKMAASLRKGNTKLIGQKSHGFVGQKRSPAAGRGGVSKSERRFAFEGVIIETRAVMV